MNADRPVAQRIARLTPLADVLALLDRLAPVEPQDVPVAQALHGVLAADIVTTQAMPPVATAVRDGWAVDADTTRDAGPYAPMMLPSSSQRIDAFAPMPPGTDAVAPIDAVTVMGGMMQIMAPVGPGEGVLPKGGDGDSGAVLRKAGQPLRAIDIASLTALGITHVSVRTPRILFALARHDDAILTAIADFLVGFATMAGATATRTDDLEAALREASVDAVIGIGGTGSGRNDHAVTALARVGTVTCHGIGISPGETSAFGKIETKPVILIPGRIDAALAAGLTLAKPMLAALGGAKPNKLTSSAALSRKITSTIGLAEVVPVRRNRDMITPLASGMLPLRTLAQADGWVLVPADSEGYPAGAIVQVRPLP